MAEETEPNTKISKNASTMESNTDLNNEDTHEDSQMRMLIVIHKNSK